MSRSNKSTVISRVDNVLRLLLAGAEFAEIRQFAAASGWDVSDRQLRRYLEAAYRRVAKIARRDRVQLLGRHLMQRRALYARAIKNNDIRTALLILRDEAELQGLYPQPQLKNDSTPQDQLPPPIGLPGPTLSRRERVVRRLTAEARKDRVELKLLRQTARYCAYRFDETEIPYQMLQIMALIYVSEQLEYAGIFLYCVWQLTVKDDQDETLDLLGTVAAYRFQVGREAWKLFTSRLGVDGDDLVQGNYFGCLLEICSDNICGLGFDFEEIQAVFAANGLPLESPVMADTLCHKWERMFAKVCQEW